MRFRLGLVIGAAFGYVLGARAGRERYEEIKQWAASLRRHPAVSQLVDQGVGLIDAGRHGVSAMLLAGGKGLRSLGD
jgi:hypothetical protein